MGNPFESAKQLVRGDEKFAGGGKTFLLSCEEKVLLGLREGFFRPDKTCRGVFGDDHAPPREVIEDGGGAAIETGEQQIRTMVPDPLPEHVGAAPGACARGREEVIAPGDDLGTGYDDKLPPFGTGPLGHRIEPANRFDPVCVQRDPGRPVVGGAVHIHDPSADGVVPRVGRGGQPRVTEFAKAPG